MMVSQRQKVFDFMKDNQDASNDEIYEEFNAMDKKEKDTVRRYRNQFLKEHEGKENTPKSSGIGGISRTIPSISQDIPPVYQEIDEDEPEMDFSILDIPEGSDGISQSIPPINFFGSEKYPHIVYVALKHYKRTWFKNNKPEKEGKMLDEWNEMEEILNHE